MKTWNRHCTKCVLHKTAQTIGMDGPLQSSSAKLLVYLDYPTAEEDRKHKAGSSNNILFVRWLLEERMQINPDDYQIQFTLKCHKPKNVLKKKPERLAAIQACQTYVLSELRNGSDHIRSIASMGSISCEAFFGGAQLKTKNGLKAQSHNKEIGKVWVTSSPASCLPPGSPSETYRLYRVLFMAAKDAGLNPQHNPNFKPFDFQL